jgi:predicted DNA-binding transcriptional regulator AlpA
MEKSIRRSLTQPAHQQFDSRVASASPTLSEEAAARYLGMSRAWLKKSRTQRFRAAMDAPPFIQSGARRVVYRREDLDAWQRQRRELVGPSRMQASGGGAR